MAGGREYTIVVTVNGKRVPVELKGIEGAFRSLAINVDVNLKKAEAAYKRFGNTASEAHDKLTRALLPLQRDNSELRTRIALLKQAGDAQQWKLDKVQRDNQIRAAGLGLYSQEGRALREVIKDNQALTRELNQLTEARRREQAEARRASQQQTRVKVAVAKEVQGAQDLEQRVAVAKRGVQAENELTGAIKARTIAQKLGISASSEEYKTLERATIAQAKAKRELNELTAAKERAANATSKFRAIFLGFIATLGTFTLVGFVRGVVEARLEYERFSRTLAVASGSVRAAAVDYKFVRSETERLGLDLRVASLNFAQLAAASKTSHIEAQTVKASFTAVAEASTVMGLSAQRTELVLYALQQMISKGRVYREELVRQMGDNLPGAFSIASRAMGVSEIEMNKMLRTGLSTAEFLPKFAAELRKTFAPGVAQAVTSTQAQINRFKTASFEASLVVADGLTPSIIYATKVLNELLTTNKQVATDIGTSLGSAIKISTDLLMIFGKNIELVKAALVALIIIKATLFFVDMAQGVRHATGALVIFNKQLTTLSIHPVIAAVALLAAGFYLLTQRIDDGKPAITSYDALLRDHIKLLGEAKAKTIELAYVQAQESKSQYVAMQQETANAIANRKALQEELDELRKPKMFRLSGEKERGELEKQIKNLDNVINVAFNNTLPKARQKMLEFNKNFGELDKLSKQNTESADDYTNAEIRRLDQIQRLLEASDRELRQQREMLNARKISAKAAEDLARAHEFENEMANSGLDALGKGIDASSKEVQIYAMRIKTRIDLAYAIDKVIEAENNAKDAYDQASKAYVSLAMDSKELVFENVDSVKAWGASLGDLGLSIYRLELALETLSPESSLYGIIVGQLTSAQEKYNKAIAETPAILESIRRKQDEDSRSAEFVVKKELENIDKEAQSYRLSGIALKEYNKELRIHEEVLRIVANLTPYRGEGPDNFGKRWLETARTVRGALEGLYSEMERQERKQQILAPARQALSGLKDYAIDIAVDIAMGFEVNFKEVFQNIMEMFVRMLIEMAVKAAATRIVLNVSTYGSGGGIGGMFGGTGIWGAIGKGILGNPMTGGISSAAMAGIFAAAAAVIINQIKTSGRSHARTDIDIGGFQGLGISGQTGHWNTNAAGNYNKTLTAASEVIKVIREFIEGIGAQIDETAEVIARVGIGKVGQGKKTNWYVTYGKNLVKNFGGDVEAALEFGAVQAIKATKLKGLDPIVLRAIQKSMAETMENLQKDIALATTIADMGKSQIEIDLKKIAPHFDELRRSITALLGPSEELNESLRRLSLGEQQAWQSARDAITQREKTAEEDYQDRLRQAAVFNAELALRKLDIQQARADIAIKIERILSGELFNRALRDETINFIETGRDMIRAVGGMSIAMATGAGMTQEAIDNMINRLRQQDENLRKLEEGLPAPIDPGEVRRGRDGGGGTDRKAEDRERVQDILRQHELDIMDEYARRIEETNRKYNEAILLAHGDKEAIDALNKARQEEIDKINQQLRDRAAPWLGDWGKTDFQQQIDDFNELIELLDQLPRAEMPNWMLDLIRGRFKEQKKEELEERIASLGGADPVIQEILQIGKTADVLRQDIIALGLSAEETARLLEGVAEAEKHRTDMIKMDVLDKLYGYLKEDARYKNDIIANQRRRVELEFAIIQAQLKVLGIWEQFADVWNDAKDAALKIASGLDEVSDKLNYSDSIRHLYAEKRMEREQELLEEQKRQQELAKEAAEEFADLIKDLRDYKQSLLFVAESPLTKYDQYQKALQAYERLEPGALSGDVEALKKAKEIIQQFLESSSAYYGGTAQHTINFERIQRLLEQITNLNYTNGNVVYPAQFFTNSAIQATTTTSNATNGAVINFNNQELVTEMRSIKESVDDMELALKDLTYKIENESSRNREYIGTTINQIGRAVSAMERIASKVA